MSFLPERFSKKKGLLTGGSHQEFSDSGIPYPVGRTIPPDSNADPIVAFLAKYKDPVEYERWVRFADCTKQDCESLLKKNGIKAVVTCRTKQYESLKKKMEDLARDPDFRAWLGKGHSIYHYSEMGDLAGVRIGLFFPDDVPTVVKLINDRFIVRHTFGTVTGGRDTVSGRNEDSHKHYQGPWRSQDSNRNEEDWQHYGYKSWQQVVEWGENYSPIIGLTAPRVEIQVGTVVTQAWAEVQHNIIYKRSNDVLATPTMKRMIDAINGMAITTEIMLRELKRSVEAAELEARRKAQGAYVPSAKNTLGHYT
jgi:ppGpp synthetase/RelA/SpoT-type nucleotidyltranferase